MTNPQCWTNSRRTSTVPRSCSACSTGIPERKGAWQLAKEGHTVMNKYEIDCILELIKRIQSKESVKTAGKRFGADTSCLCKRFGIYECRGPERWRDRHGSCPVEFKALVILCKKRYSLSARETAASSTFPPQRLFRHGKSDMTKAAFRAWQTNGDEKQACQRTHN